MPVKITLEQRPFPLDTRRLINVENTSCRRRDVFSASFRRWFRRRVSTGLGRCCNVIFAEFEQILAPRVVTYIKDKQAQSTMKNYRDALDPKTSKKNNKTSAENISIKY